MKPRRLTFDIPLDELDSPARGDVLASRRAVYRILDARPVESRVWDNRWSLTLKRCGTIDGGGVGRFLEAPDARVWHSVPYRRGETPAGVFGAAA